MEYEHRRKRAVYLIFYFVYIAGVVYLLLKSNPYLYSHNELRSYLKKEKATTIAALPQAGQTELAGPTGTNQFWPRLNPERTGVNSSGIPFNKDYMPNWHKDLDVADLKLASDSIVADASGIYLAGQSPWVTAVNPEGELLWTYRFLPSSAKSFAPVIDQSLLYLSWNNGQIVTLDKKSGLPHWKVRIGQKILSNPILQDGVLFVVVLPLESESARVGTPRKGDSKKPVLVPEIRLALIKASTGELMNYSEAFNANDPVSVTYSRDNKLFVITTDNRLIAISQDTGRLVMNESTPDPIRGAAMIADGRILLSLNSGKVQAWDQTKKGKFEWEIELDSSPAGALTYIPLYQRLALITENGRLQMMDLKKNERLWNFNIENHNPVNEAMTVQLQSKFISQYSLAWDKRGWTLLAPCSEKRLCLYNPEKGQLITRINAEGPIVALPAFVGKIFYLVTTSKNGGETRYKVSQYIDEASFKKKDKEKSNSKVSEAN